MRIDRAISPPGLIKGAVAYSLFSTTRGLYMIKTGRGWRMKFQPSGAINQFAANKAVARIQSNVEAAEQELNDDDLEGELDARKGSIFLTRSEISDIELRTDSLPDLRFKVDGKKYRVEFAQDRTTDVEAFVADLKR